MLDIFYVNLIIILGIVINGRYYRLQVVLSAWQETVNEVDESENAKIPQQAESLNA